MRKTAQSHKQTEGINLKEIADAILSDLLNKLSIFDQ